MEATESSSIVKSEPVSQRAIILADSLKADTEQRQLLGRYIHEHMKENTDFGKIPGTDKPTLLKPGAEKLVDLFRCTPKFHLVKCDEDFDKGFFNYMFRVRLVGRDSGAVLAEGFGSANSREGRYRWRNAQLRCPECKKETLLKSKKEPGYFCWAKKGGCGATFGPDEAAITSQSLGKVDNEDIATLANTILKMAKKRAMVDGAIALARCSDMFTQDVEDFADHSEQAEAPRGQAEPPPHGATTTAPRTAPRDVAPKSAREGGTEHETKAAAARAARVRRVWAAAKSKGLDESGFRNWTTNVLEGDKKPSTYWTDKDIDRLEAALDLLQPNREPGADG